MPTVIASQRVRQDRFADYHRAQRKLNLLVREQPGFCGTEIISPVDGLQEDWVAIFRFDTNENLERWMNLPERKALVEELSKSLHDSARYQVIADNENEAKPSTAVFSHRILPGHEAEFADWKRRIIRARTRFPGHLGSEMFEPVPGVQDEWVDIVRFDRPENLEAWMQSPERKALIREAAAFTERIEAKRLATGLENWFRLSGRTGGEEDPAPVWKQSCLVLLALFPTAMLLRLGLSPFLGDVPLPLHMLIGNFLGVAALAYLLLPRLTRWFGFWLHPSARRKGRANDLLGALLIAALLAAFLAAFLVAGPSAP